MQSAGEMIEKNKHESGSEKVKRLAEVWWHAVWHVSGVGGPPRAVRMRIHDGEILGCELGVLAV